VEQRAEARFRSRWGGEWRAISFWNKATRNETLALVKGHIDPARPTLVRMHALSMFEDIFAQESDRNGMLEGAMQIIGEEGAGVVVLINRPLPDYASRAIRNLGPPHQPGDGPPDMPSEQRDYGVGAQILAEIGVRDMVLLTNTHHALVGLEGYGLSIVGERPIEGSK
jgi:3,4-dihydroxy 2-butanone 4-phosphate synthase / GTP cyclohydrolase II